MSKSLYQAMSLALVRTPLLTVECATDLTAHNALVDTAIAISSPTLHSHALKSESSKASDIDFKTESYRRRMSRRTTPYGLHAGVALAEFGDSTDLCRAEVFETSTRADMSWVIPYLEKLESSPTIRKQLKVFSNPECVVHARRLWLDRISTSNAGQRKQGVHVRATPPVIRVLEYAARGIVFEKLVARIATEFDVSIDKSNQLCTELCNQTILISELRVPLTTCHPLEALQQILSVLQNLEVGMLNEILEFQQSMRSWDAAGEKSAGAYTAMRAKAQNIASTERDLLQTDTLVGLDRKHISTRVADELAVAAELCLRFSSKADNLAAFKQRFVDRYQARREVPLLDLLSERFGIGSPYGKPGSKGATFAATQKRDSLLLEIASRATRKGQLVASLSEKEIAALEQWRPNVEEAPVSLDLFAFISASSREEIDNGNFELVIAPRVGEIGAGRTIGRFAFMIGDKAIQLLEAISNIEEQAASGCVIADVSYYPEVPRYANVVIAPSLRKYRISVDVPVPSQEADYIPLSEIVVSLENGSFFAVWSRTGQRIIARSNNMLNSSLIPVPIRFLLEIGLGKISMLQTFHWGVAEKLPFLPRIQIGKVILRPAEWKIQSITSREHLASAASFKAALENWRHDWNVPNLVDLCPFVARDNTLRFDISDDTDLERLRIHLRRNSSAIIQEHIPCDSWHSTQRNQHFATEIVGSLVRTDLARVGSGASSKKAGRPSQAFSPQRCLQTPGSDWLYLRLDSSALMHDELIVRVNQKATDLFDGGLIRQWFFVRYFDYGEHLRVRFLVNPSKLFSELLPVVCTWASDLTCERLCHEFSIQTYDQEIERYGGEHSIRSVEELFSIDSQTTAQIIGAANFADLDRAIVGVLSLYYFMKPFFADDPETMLQWLRSGISIARKRQVSAEYRQNKQLLCALLSNEITSENSKYLDVANIMLAAVKNMNLPVEKLLHLAAQDLLTISIPVLCDSVSHMHSNRLLGMNRSVEMRIRTLLANSIETILKRGKARPLHNRVGGAIWDIRRDAT